MVAWAVPPVVPQGDLAQAIIRDWCGWHIAPSVTETIKVRASGNVILLPSLHVTAVSSVTWNGQQMTGWDWTSLGSLSLTSWHDDHIGHHDCWEHHHHVGDAAYEVTLTHGYPTLPAAVAGVARGLMSRAGSAGSSAFVRIGPFQMATASDGSPLGASLTDADRAALARYRLPPRP